MVQHVFISYHHGDIDFAENVINRVEKVGFSTWTDDKLHAGEDWRAMIDIAIKNAFALVVIMTPEAKASEYVTYEWAFAWGVGVKVIPLMLRPTPLHPRLEAMQYLDFINPKSRPWERLIEEIKAAANVPLAYTINIPLNSPPYVRQAVIALDSPNEMDRIAAIDTLQRVGSLEAQTVLFEALQHPIDDVRKGSAEALGAMGVTSAVSALIKLVQDAEIEVRIAAVGALGKLGDIAALPMLAERLRDLEAKKLRRAEYKAVVITMGKLGDVAVVPRLVKILVDGNAISKYFLDNQDCIEIGQIVGSLGDITVIPVLNKAKRRLLLGSNYEQVDALERAIRMLQQRTDEEKQQDVPSPEKT